MNININQHRAAVGTYYNIALRGTFKQINFINTSNLYPILIILNYGIDSLPLALIAFLCMGFLPSNTYQLNSTFTNSTNHSYFNMLTKPMIKMKDIGQIVSHILVLLLLICMDVEPNPGPENTLSIVHNNIYSLQNKAIYIEAELSNFDIITLSETWLYGNFPEERLKITGFQKPIRRDREDNSGYGGVAIYVKNGIYAKHRPDLEVNSLEAIWIETRNDQEILLVGCFYRPPNSRVAYWDLINESIHKAASTPYKYFILGDFNASHLTQHFAHLDRIIQLNRLQQVINEATRYTDNTATVIDIILTSSPNSVSKAGVLPPVKSDHCCPFIEIKSNSKTFHMSSFKRLLLNYNKLDTIKFENSLRTTNWEEIVTIDDLDEAALLFSNTLFDITKNCMPVKTELRKMMPHG